MVWIVRTGRLLASLEWETRLQPTLRMPRPPNLPLLLSKDGALLEAPTDFLHEHALSRGCTDDTLRTYTEVLFEWFETLEQNGIDWTSADALDLIAYR